MSIENAFLTLFDCKSTLDELEQSSSRRFCYEKLFDRHLVFMIYDFLVFKLPLLAPLSFGTYGVGDTQFHCPVSLCVHPFTGHLWVADTENKRLCLHSTENKELKRIRSIKCQGNPQCVRTSNIGRVFVAETTPSAVSILDALGTTCGRFGQGILESPVCLAINNKQHQIAITENCKSIIHVYTFEGRFICILNTQAYDAKGLCWNENESLLYTSSWFNHCVHVLDAKTDTCICTWGRKLNSEHGQFDYPCGILYKTDTKEVLVTDEFNQRVVVMDCQGSSLKSCVMTRKGSIWGDVAGPNDLALHHRDNYNQLFVCERLNHRILVIELN